jgi:NADH dehydrogenase
LKKASEIQASNLLPPVVVDITREDTLSVTFENASVVVSLVGIMHGTLSDFDRIQHKGAENVARAARKSGAKLIHISAIGADKNSTIPYVKTKGLGEEAVLRAYPEATIIRPSLVFGPGDGFFAVCRNCNMPIID